MMMTKISLIISLFIITIFYACDTHDTGIYINHKIKYEITCDTTTIIKYEVSGTQFTIQTNTTWTFEFKEKIDHYLWCHAECLNKNKSIKAVIYVDKKEFASDEGKYMVDVSGML